MNVAILILSAFILSLVYKHKQTVSCAIVVAQDRRNQPSSAVGLKRIY